MLLKNELYLKIHYKIDDEEYNLGEDKLYNVLREHPEEVEPIVKLLLEAVTFGNNFGEIMTLPFDSLDTETINAIKRIRNSITKIRNNNIIKLGFDKMFNKNFTTLEEMTTFIAEKYNKKIYYIDSLKYVR